MSSIFAKIGDDILAIIKGAGKTVETIAISDFQVAVAAAKQTELGTLAESLIQIFDSHSALTGTQKMESVIGALVPLATTLIAGGGIPAIEGQVVDFVREFAQSAYNDLKAALAKAAVGAATKLAT